MCSHASKYNFHSKRRVKNPQTGIFHYITWTNANEIYFIHGPNILLYPVSVLFLWNNKTKQKKLFFILYQMKRDKYKMAFGVLFAINITCNAIVYTGWSALQWTFLFTEMTIIQQVFQSPQGSLSHWEQEPLYSYKCKLWNCVSNLVKLILMNNMDIDDLKIAFTKHVGPTYTH